MSFTLLYLLTTGKMTGVSTQKSRVAMVFLCGAILGVQIIITPEAIPRNPTEISTSTAKREDISTTPFIQLQVSLYILTIWNQWDKILQ